MLANRMRENQLAHMSLDEKLCGTETSEVMCSHKSSLVLVLILKCPSLYNKHNTGKTGVPPGCKTIRSKWLFKKKTDMDGIVHVYKARLVAKGYTQLYRVDYEETFSPVADIRAIIIPVSIAANTID
ncbi:retrotransposon protein, putative, ty1-copia subclass [Tanacetum coccineum]